MLPTHQQLINMANALEEQAGLASLSLSGAKAEDLLEWHAAQLLRQVATHVQQENKLQEQRNRYLNSLSDYEDSMRGDDYYEHDNDRYD